MEVIEPGHIYQLDQQDLGQSRQRGEDPPSLKLIFVNREDNPHPGTQTQEVLRVLIDRTMHCDNCLRWEGNDLIIYHLRMALVLHEARALIRKTQKGIITPERMALGDDGHFELDGGKIDTHDALLWERQRPREDSPLREDMGK